MLDAIGLLAEELGVDAVEPADGEVADDPTPEEVPEPAVGDVDDEPDALDEPIEEVPPDAVVPLAVLSLALEAELPFEPLE